MTLAVVIVTALVVGPLGWFLRRAFAEDRIDGPDYWQGFADGEAFRQALIECEQVRQSRAFHPSTGGVSAN